MNDNKQSERFERVLCIYANAFGFGYALMEGVMDVQAHGQKAIRPICNKGIMKHISELVEEHKPDSLIMENVLEGKCHKGERTKKLVTQLRSSAKRQGLSFSTYSRAMIRHVFARWDAKTKYEIALNICDNLPAFHNIMYKKPNYYDNEKYMTGVFDAVSLGVTHFFLLLDKEIESNSNT